MNIRRIYLPHSLGLLGMASDNSRLLPEIHRLLKKHGCYEGAEHNLYDSNTREAIAEFQMRQGLRPTATLDHTTYCRLFDAAVSEIEPIEKTDRVYGTLANANILITKSNRQLTLFNGKTTIRQFPVAIGKPSTPTPEGNYAIATKILNPGGVLGTRWMGLNYDAYGIHGTNRPWLIGQMVSNGCIRMHNHNAEELFALIRIGTPVFIR
ncbi:MAG: murein L,D-transpeptidase [Veillonellaceae bacterium]|jgi:lipoprotein-anchoring transpeptidase ErfK/SrfK|nr:murein L,D-transpeptidase [Veillonellaceae bacterium]